jgi:hypothetical protein
MMTAVDVVKESWPLPRVTTPPCGVPAVVGVNVSASIIPERTHARTCRRMPDGAWSFLKSAA